MALLLALFSSVLWGSADFEGGRMAKKFPAIAVTGASQALGLVVGIGIVLITGEWRTPAFGVHGYFFPAVIAGVAGYLGLVALYAGLATGRMGVVSPISSLCAIIPVTVALISGEHLPMSTGIGIAIALVGAFCASGPEISQGLPFRPVLLAIGAAVGFGTALSFMARGSISSALMTMVMMRITTLFISVGLAVKYRTVGGFAKGDLPRLIYIGAADFSANVLLGVASTKGLVSIVMVLGSLFPIMTAILAYKILHERLHRIQYAGIVLAIAGVAIISAS
ncbi:MAG: DMT family transporter [Candidatus Nanopelagicaceae bacterium]|nr:DMT family transporter [Candidatus Nanopelagicaceae bacterium]